MDQAHGDKVAWRRLLVEGGLIVLSILLAFAIDAAWTEWQERRQEQEVLAALRSDFVENRTALESTLALQTAAEDRMARLAQLSTAEVLALDPDSVVVMVNSFAYPATFDPIRATVDAMIGAGNLGVIRSERLRQALTAFLNSVEDAGEDARYMQEFAVRTWDAMTGYGGPWDAPFGGSGVRAPYLAEPSAQDLADLSADPRVMGLGLQGRVNATIYVHELRIIRAQIDQILEMVNAEIT